MRKRLFITLLVIVAVAVVAKYATQPHDLDHEVPIVVTSVAIKPKAKVVLREKLNAVTMPLPWELDPEEVLVEEPISEKVGFIIGKDKEATWPERHENSNLLKGALSSADRLALLQFLDSYPTEEDLEAQLAYHSVKTNILDYLIDVDPDFDPELMKTLIVKVISDEDQHVVMREYTAQVVTAFYKRRWGMIEVGDMPKEWLEIETALWEASHEKKDALAGTALRQLVELKHMSVQHNATDVHDRAQQVAEDDVVSIASRLGAMDVLIEMGREEDRLYLKQLAMTEDEDVLIRMKAIYGASEKTDDKEFLRYLVSVGTFEGQDERISTAASLAVQKMNNKKGNIDK